MSAQQQPGEPVGSLGEEAVALFSVLAGWANEHAEDLVGAATATPGADAGGPSTPGSEEEDGPHERGSAATGSAAHQHEYCTGCPLCRVLGTLRQVTPEVRQHLVDAGSSLLAAASAMLATHVPDAPARTGDRPAPDRRPTSRPVQRVVLDEDDD